MLMHLFQYTGAARANHVVHLGNAAPPDAIECYPIQAFPPDTRPLDFTPNPWYARSYNTVPTGIGGTEIVFDHYVS